MSIIIKNGTVIDPLTGYFGVKDIEVQSQNPDKKIIDATGLWVCPGFIDLHVHFRDPGLTHKEDIETGLRAAVAGGFTTVCTMPNTNPTADAPETIKYQIDRAKKHGLARLLPVSAITMGLEGKELVNIEENLKAGAVAFSDDGKAVSDVALLDEFFVSAAKHKVLVMAHCEDINLDPNSNESEYTIVARDINLAIKHGARLHICHVSTRQSVDLIRRAHKKYPNLITAEVAPHHILLSSEDVKNNTNFKMAPPLRSKQDVRAVRKGLIDGTICAIATDHAPHSTEEKSVEFAKAPNGVIGLETAVGVALTALKPKSVKDTLKFVSYFTSGPASLVGCNNSDITIIDPNHQWVVTEESLKSKSRNCPFIGMELVGRVTHTIVDGELVFDAYDFS